MITLEKMMPEGEQQTKEITRTRKLRGAGGNSSVISIPPIVRELTSFKTGENVEIDAKVGGDEIILRPAKSKDESGEANEN